MLPHFHPDLPRASGHINESYCITTLQRRLLARSNILTQTIDTLNVKFPVVHHVTTVPGQSQKKDLSPGVKVLELLSPNLVCRLIGSVACLGLLLAVVPLLLTE